MSWKDELLSSREDVLGFLDRSLTSLGLPPFEIRNLSEDPKRFEPCPIERSKDDEFCAGNYGGILYFAVVEEPKGFCLIDGFFVDELWHKKKLGLMTAKACMSVAALTGSSVIELPSMDRNGPSFWPSLGAVPWEEPSDLSAAILHVLKDLENDISPQDRTKLLELSVTADTNPFLSWRHLGTSSVARPVRQAVFESICYRKSLFIIPSEATTQALLAERLGPLPPFRSPHKRWVSDLSSALRRSPPLAPPQGRSRANVCKTHQEARQCQSWRLKSVVKKASQSTAAK